MCMSVCPAWEDRVQKGPGKIVWKLARRWRCFRVQREGKEVFFVKGENDTPPVDGELYQLPEHFHLRKVEGKDYYELFRYYELFSK